METQQFARRNWMHVIPRKLAPSIFVVLSIGFPTLWLPAATGSSGAVGAPAQDKNNSYDEEFAKGVEFLRRQRFEQALKSFKRANDMRDKKSPQAILGMAQAYLGMEEHKDAIASSDKAIELSGGDPEIAAQAYNLKGMTLRLQSEGKDRKKLQESEAELRRGLALRTDIVPMLHYNLGFVLMQQNRDPEGVAELQKYLELQPNAANAADARKMIENPRRARELYAPDFSVTTSDGQQITLADLRGKIVMLDFWGAWCGPCRRSVPSLRDLNKKYSKDPAFVMIGIDTRDDEDTWRAFIAQNKMIWRHYRDEGGVVVRAFMVRAFPTYMVIDHEGIVRYRGTGANPQQESALDDAIRKQLKLIAKTTTPD